MKSIVIFVIAEVSVFPIACAWLFSSSSGSGLGNFGNALGAVGGFIGSVSKPDSSGSKWGNALSGIGSFLSGGSNGNNAQAGGDSTGGQSSGPFSAFGNLVNTLAVFLICSLATSVPAGNKKDDGTMKAFGNVLSSFDNIVANTQGGNNGGNNGNAGNAGDGNPGNTGNPSGGSVGNSGYPGAGNTGIVNPLGNMFGGAVGGSQDSAGLGDLGSTLSQYIKQQIAKSLLGKRDAKRKEAFSSM